MTNNGEVSYALTLFDFEKFLNYVIDIDEV